MTQNFVVIVIILDIKLCYDIYILDIKFIKHENLRSGHKSLYFNFKVKNLVIIISDINSGKKHI